MYVVLVPDSYEDLELFLSTNGVVLIYDDGPARWLTFMDQLPTIAANVMRPGRGHTLPSTVKGATWPEDITWERAKLEKGHGFTPGGKIPDQVRTTAWEFMGQTTPENYVNLIFGQPLSTRAAFDLKAESVMNILGEGSRQREESDDVHMAGGSPSGEEPAGGSPQAQGEEPGPGRGSFPRERHLNRKMPMKTGGKTLMHHQQNSLRPAEKQQWTKKQNLRRMPFVGRQKMISLMMK